LARHAHHIAAVLIILILLSSCTSSQIVSNLEIALDAISAGLPILATVSSVPADVVTSAETYLTAANSALGQASTILAGGGTDAEKSALIIAAFAGIAAPAIPAQYQAIAQLVSVVAADVAKFLAGLPSAQGAANAAKYGDPTTKWSDRDRARLAHALSVANANSVALAKLRGK
jgi:hypothetical protein